MSYVDFADLKTRVSIVDAVALLGLTFKRSANGQLRGQCPICHSQSERGFVITPEKNLFFCFGKCGGGDQIKLVSLVKGLDPHQAAIFLQGDTKSAEPAKAKAPVPQEQKTGDNRLQPLGYLEPSHEAVQGLGIGAETAKAFGAGYAPKGVLRGRLACPVTQKGNLLAYVGIAVSADQSPALLFHNFDPRSTIFNADNVEKGGDLYVCRDPLAVLKAVENGLPIGSVVSFLAPITAQSLETLASLMDERQVENLELV